MNNNTDTKVVAAFGDEWQRFDQSCLSEQEQLEMFEEHFCIFPWHKISTNSIGFDLGCGSGRWAKLVAPRVGKLYCIDPSIGALEVAKKNLRGVKNCELCLASVDRIPLENNTADFGYALGILHHIPNPEMGLANCVSKLKSGAPFLLYLYYAFDGQPLWFKSIWQLSEIGRFLISRCPYFIRYILSQIIAVIVYLPLSRLSLLIERLGYNVNSVPLSAYRNRTLYVMRTDALDRFGTRLEKRFTKKEILKMMENAGLEKIVFSESVPYWCAVGYKK